MKRFRTYGRCPQGHRLFFVVPALLMGCNDGPGVSHATAVTESETTTVVIDSILPAEEEIARFKRVLGGDTLRSTLRGGAGSVEELVEAFMIALAEGDSARTKALLIDRTEFINLYYPESPFARPPYRQNPAFVWFQFEQNSTKGLHRALQRYGGRDLGAHAYDCQAKPEVYGQSRLWHGCRLTWPQQTAPISLFGSIIEHAGAFKFVSYANDL